MFSDNPLICDCDTHESWEWIRDHRRQLGTSAVSGPRCEQPASVHGLLLLRLEPVQFCDKPLVLKLAIQDIQPFTVLVSWQSRNHSGLHGYQVAYYAEENLTEVSFI